jgi:hypothetical protein
LINNKVTIEEIEIKLNENIVDSFLHPRRLNNKTLTGEDKTLNPDDFT